ncbi:MAPEG family protein [Salinisphaera sp. SPP-AMP-43]|uniref:MAPEG family protein n=1 Tax=Salinisphaera sp. SPP-AMP-43 TaxID=3121288 RepID=UPI003C6DDC4B
MILAYWCVLIAAFMPIGFVGYAKFAGQHKMGSNDNRHPREWLAQTEGAQKRAYWAQLNGFEAFPPFAAGVIIAVISGGSIGVVNLLAVLFILLRLVYGWCYITDRASLRSLVWAGATACTVALFITGAIG